MKISNSWAGLWFGLVLASATSCSPVQKKCSPTTCAIGCCDAAGECQPGSSTLACGQLGAQCSQCAVGQACNLGFCGGGTTGGGGGTTGGGGGSTGGGGGSTGGGGGSTGGGGGSTGGGGGSTGGGGGTTCDGCFFNGTCIVRANSNNNTVCGQGGVVCATCTASQSCVNYVCTGNTGGGGGATGGGTGGGATGGGTGGGATGGGTGGGTGASNETCSLALAITAGTLVGDTTGMNNSYDPGCTGDITPGADAVYRITVPVGQRLIATATPDPVTSGNQYDLAVYLIQSPASNCLNPDGGLQLSCLSASDNPNVLNSSETASTTNGTGSPVDVFIVIDSYFSAMVTNPDGGVGAADQGRFTLVTSLGAPSAGDRCDTAVTLSSGVALNNQDLATFGNDYDGTGAGCTGSTAADATYKVVVPNGQVLSLTATPSATFDPTLSLSDAATSCGVTCLDAVDVGADGDPETYTYRNTTGASRTLYVVVDGYRGSTGTFSLLATLSTPPADDTCALPLALTSGVAVTAQLLTGYTNDYTAGTNCGAADGVDRAYSIVVPNGQRVLVTATPGATVDPSLSLVDGAANCGVTCLASAAAGSAGAVETLTFTNASGTSRTYLVLVDFASTSTGAFDLVATVGPPPADDVCGGATTLTVGTPLTGQSTLGFTNDYQNGTGTVGCSSNGVTGPDRVYQFAVPNTQRAVVTVTPTSSGYNPSLNLVDGAAAVCAALPRVCAAGSNLQGAGVAESVSLFNTSGAPKSYFAIVDGTTSGDFSIGFTSAPPVANDTCTTNNLTLVAGTRVAENLTGFSADYTSGIGCLQSAGPDRVYRVQLTANQKYGFTVTPTGTNGGFDPVINFIPAPASNCEASPRTCRGGMDSTVAYEAETGTFTNNTGAPLDLFVIVGDYDAASTSREYSLLSTIGAAPAGESCGVPLVLTAGALPGQTTAGASADVAFSSTATNCAPSRAPDNVYTATVPAGQTLTVTATPAAREDLIINVIEGTAATCNNVLVCATSADTGFESDPETAIFTNSTGAPKTVFVQVTGYGLSLAYGLTVTIQ